MELINARRSVIFPERSEAWSLSSRVSSDSLNKGEGAVGGFFSRLLYPFEKEDRPS